ncbi:hypothetical protein QJ850_gp394 [Acanthamoeba polyphaga mimivirus]|uniref:Uncharacterized protein n=1 Tax=Acanthamoeba polyphaga mimivirus Kroon TaxID=3069720 RepID=A0A0G2Y3E2_9VIRU|nr:hypothetical protein QJ850_gp394 [Acanthamoeba polyphaga mimivirus]AKI80305.1 hypothetical protein [Acanthamoeba polyphaga mimivirus Kroon]
MDPSILSQLEYKTTNNVFFSTRIFIIRDDNDDIKYFKTYGTLTNYDNDSFLLVDLNVMIYDTVKSDYLMTISDRQEFILCSASITDLKNFRIKGSRDTTNNNILFHQFTKNNPLIVKSKNDPIYLEIKFQCEMRNLKSLLFLLTGPKCRIKNVDENNYINEYMHFDNFIEIYQTNEKKHEIVVFGNNWYEFRKFIGFELYNLNFSIINNDMEITEVNHDRVSLSLNKLVNRIDFKSPTEDDPIFIESDKIPIVQFIDKCTDSEYYRINFTVKKIDEID